MKHRISKILLLGVSLLVLSACSGRKIEVLGYVPELESVSAVRYMHNEITNVAIVPTIGQAALITSSELSEHVKTKGISKNIVVTSMVNVNNMRESSDFGRLYSESMMTNFKRLGWSVIDFRGVNVFTKVKGGEFYLDRSKLKNIPKDSLIYVGTYGEYQQGLLLNTRMLDRTSNQVITASNVQLNDVNSLLLSRISNCQSLKCREMSKNTFHIGLKQDDCSNAARCECSNPDKCLKEMEN